MGFGSSESIPRNAIAGSNSESVFRVVRNGQTVFQSNCTILHPPPAKYERSSFSTSSPTCGVISVPEFGPSNRCIAVGLSLFEFAVPRWPITWSIKALHFQCEHQRYASEFRNLSFLHFTILGTLEWPVALLTSDSPCAYIKVLHRKHSGSDGW